MNANFSIALDQEICMTPIKHTFTQSQIVNSLAIDAEQVKEKTLEIHNSSVKVGPTFCYYMCEKCRFK